MGRRKKWSIWNMVNTACFSYCSILSCLPQLPVIQATDRRWSSSRSHMVQVAIPDLQLFKNLFVCQPAICCLFVWFFLNAKMNRISFPEGEIASFLSRCTKYKFQPFARLAIEGSAAFIFSFAPVTASPSAFSIPGEYLVWTRMSS